jgi:hypothetical protein
LSVPSGNSSTAAASEWEQPSLKQSKAAARSRSGSRASARSMSIRVASSGVETCASKEGANSGRRRRLLRNWRHAIRSSQP